MANGVEDATWNMTLNQGTRGTTDLSKNTSALAFTTVPDGFLFYTNAQDRVDSWLLLGPTTTIANSPQREPFLKYHSENASGTASSTYAGVKGSLDYVWTNGHSTGDAVTTGFFNADTGWANLTYWARGGATVYLERFLKYGRWYAANTAINGGTEWTKWYRTPRRHHHRPDPRTRCHAGQPGPDLRGIQHRPQQTLH
jgi:hypothetical protein